MNYTRIQECRQKIKQTSIRLLRFQSRKRTRLKEKKLSNAKCSKSIWNKYITSAAEQTLSNKRNSLKPN